MALTRLAHQLVRRHFEHHATGIAVDATCGNGHDTEFLARLGFDSVHGFDVQASAIANTQERIEQAGLAAKVRLHCQGHETMLESVKGAADCIMFNFGYLPKADKTITTSSTTSIKALEASLKLLSQSGLVCLICYPGHPEGMIETKAIQDWLEQQKQHWQINQHLSKSPKPEAPVLYTIQTQS